MSMRFDERDSLIMRSVPLLDPVSAERTFLEGVPSTMHQHTG